MLGAHGHDTWAARRTESYRSRKPEEYVLYTVMAGNLETFLARQQERGRPVPAFGEREMRAFLECGVLAYGFLLSLPFALRYRMAYDAALTSAL